MTYGLEVYSDAQEQIAALPDGAASALAEVFTLLELSPWSGDPLHERNPDGAVRTLPFGSHGMVFYLVLDDQRRVDVLNVVWSG